MKIGNRIQLIKPNRINDEIKARQVRLIGINNESIGIMNLKKALQYAEYERVDLVEISPNATPPVCRIMNYGKFLYEKNKNLKEQRKKQKIVQIKEIKFRPSTEEGDYQVKLRNLIKFLEQGNKVKITLRFRGREMAHQDLGIQVLQRVQKDLMKFSVLESFPTRVEGRQMIMVLNPKKK
ncbi:Translation initiation factor IF-3 [Buchnera aphidicola (Phyllaphis fagi)]|uniref:translation initiation factor IF-3 n=1 Tax=Buchnera aphidicola TaxID=9 RepID=UPI003463D5FD